MTWILKTLEKSWESSNVVVKFYVRTIVLGVQFTAHNTEFA